MNSEFIGGTQAKQSCNVRAIDAGSGRADQHLPSLAWWVTAAEDAGALGGDELAAGAEGAGEGGVGWRFAFRASRGAGGFRAAPRSV